MECIQIRWIWCKCTLSYTCLKVSLSICSCKDSLMGGRTISLGATFSFHLEVLFSFTLYHNDVISHFWLTIAALSVAQHNHQIAFSLSQFFKFFIHSDNLGYIPFVMPHKWDCITQWWNIISKLDFREDILNSSEVEPVVAFATFFKISIQLKE